MKTNALVALGMYAKVWIYSGYPLANGETRMISRYLNHEWYVLDQFGFLVTANVTYIKAQWVAFRYPYATYVCCDHTKLL